MESWDIITTLSQVECVVYPITKIKGFVIFYNMKNTKSIDFNIDVWIFWMKNNIYIYIRKDVHLNSTKFIKIVIYNYTITSQM
jgi:hypothetical protein